ncbi:MAG: SMP-30/gluconolactonase/LRE family protein, partial [Gemmatimonadales bacterium]|nr:SMP-30/gluconolactonase/LRE family protein [Gemmatimonadales bacterium]
MHSNVRALAVLTSLLAATSRYPPPAHAQRATIDRIVEHLSSGAGALEAGDTAGYLASTGRAYALAPGLPFVAYHHARAHAPAGRRDSALTLLGRLAREQSVIAFDAPADSAFTGLAGDPGFRSAVAAIERARQPISRSTTAFELPERDLIAEGVAHDPKTGTLFLSSMYKRKIVAIAPDGAARDFAATGADGLGPVVGMEVDPSRRTLWAAAMYLPEGGIPFPDSTLMAHGVLFKYHVDTGRLIKRYVRAPGDDRHGFNDLTILPNGDTYVTDSQGGGVFLVSAKADTLVQVVPSGTYVFPNGITATDDGRRLFVAHGGGIDRIDLPSYRRTSIAAPDSLNLGGGDGLAFYRNSLIAHQPSGFNRVIRFYLDHVQARV